MDLTTATTLLQRHLGTRLNVTAIAPMTGGMSNTVLELTTDGDPPVVVAKISTEANAAGLEYQFKSARYIRRYTSFPVPAPLALVADRELGIHALLMERLGGCNLHDANLSEQGERYFQIEMARLLADLHAHRRLTYGPAWQRSNTRRWLDVFGPDLADEFAAVADRLSPPARKTIERLLANLDGWLPESQRPTLVHGDLWDTNILIDDRDADRPVITGFVDGGAVFRDVEFELAYLRVFHTVGETFFEFYMRRHPLRDGFDRRCRVYWLKTMMLHLRYFSDEYLPRCEELARQIEAME